MELRFNLLFVVPVVFGCVQCAEKSLPQFTERPNWLKVCSRSNPNENNCFKEMFEGIFPYIARGIPEVNIAPFDPLKIKKIAVSRNSGEVIQLNGSFQDLFVKGPKNTTVKRAVLDLEKKYLNFDLEIPRLRINATYNLKGNILLLPLVGSCLKSHCVNIALKDIKTSVQTKISLRNLPEEAIHIDQMRVAFSIGAMRIHLDNLFNGNKVLSASLNMFLNQNSKEIINELKGELENGISDIFIGLWNTVFNKLPLKLWMT